MPDHTGRETQSPSSEDSTCPRTVCITVEACPTGRFRASILGPNRDLQAWSFGDTPASALEGITSSTIVGRYLDRVFDCDQTDRG